MYGNSEHLKTKGRQRCIMNIKTQSIDRRLYREHLKTIGRQTYKLNIKTQYVDGGK